MARVMKTITGTYSLVDMSKPQQADSEVLITFLKLPLYLIEFS